MKHGPRKGLCGCDLCDAKENLKRYCAALSKANDRDYLKRQAECLERSRRHVLQNELEDDSSSSEEDLDDMRIGRSMPLR